MEEVDEIVDDDDVVDVDVGSGVEEVVGAGGPPAAQSTTTWPGPVSKLAV